MRRLLAWLAGAAGAGAAYRALRRRPQSAVAADPAEELRAKLAEAREAPEPEAAAEEPLDVEARRRAVHDEARAAIDELDLRDS